MIFDNTAGGLIQNFNLAHSACILLLDSCINYINQKLIAIKLSFLETEDICLNPV